MCAKLIVIQNPPEAELKTLGCTNFKLWQLMRRVTQHYDLEMAGAGLKTTQYLLLSHRLKSGPLRPGELAKAMKMSASTLARNLKPLGDAGWLAGWRWRPVSMRAAAASP